METPSASDAAFLDGGGYMGALMRTHDWSRSPLGEPAGWPSLLKSAIATMLNTRFPMVIWWGPDLLMLYNDAWQPILGSSKHPAGLGRPGRESWPETWPVVGAQFEGALKGTASWSEDLLLASDRRGYLEECYFTYSHSPLKDGAGEVVGVLSVVSETTAHVLTERRLRVLRDLSAATVDATNELRSLTGLCGVLIERLCDRNPDVPFAVQYLLDDRGAARVAAAAGAERASFPAIVEPGGGDRWGIAEVLGGSSSVRVDVQAVAPALSGGVWDEPVTEAVTLPLVRSSTAGDLCGIAVIGVNSRLRLDAQYADWLGLVAAQLAGAISAMGLVAAERFARAEAEQATNLKDQFLATLSHELRTPLNAVVGWVDILKMDPTDATKVARAVEVIERNASLQARLITDLLDLSRITSGSMRLDVGPLDIMTLVQDAIQSVTPDAAAKGVTIALTIDPQLEPSRGDSARVQQILWNLLVNAVRHGRERVDVTVTSSADRVRIRITDDGEGIEPDFLPHIFERFRQADGSNSRRHGGLGLGLALVKQLAELHGGSVAAASDGPGTGATFTLELPKGKGTTAVGREAAASPTLTSPAKDALRGTRVLALDDQADAVEVLRRILQGYGAEVRTASSAEEALRILQDERFDVIVSDIAMPAVDGYEFLTRLRARGVQTPAVALSALALPMDKARAAAAGFQAHVAKPVDTLQLLATLDRVMRGA